MATAPLREALQVDVEPARRGRVVPATVEREPPQNVDRPVGAGEPAPGRLIGALGVREVLGETCDVAQPDQVVRAEPGAVVVPARAHGGSERLLVLLPRLERAPVVVELSELGRRRAPRARAAAATFLARGRRCLGHDDGWFSLDRGRLGCLGSGRSRRRRLGRVRVVDGRGRLGGGGVDPQPLPGRQRRPLLEPGARHDDRTFTHGHGQRLLARIPARGEPRAGDVNLVAPGAYLPARLRPVNDRDLDGPLVDRHGRALVVHVIDVAPARAAAA